MIPAISRRLSFPRVVFTNLSELLKTKPACRFDVRNISSGQMSKWQQDVEVASVSVTAPVYKSTDDVNSFPTHIKKNHKHV